MRVSGVSCQVATTTCVFTGDLSAPLFFHPPPPSSLCALIPLDWIISAQGCVLKVRHAMCQTSCARTARKNTCLEKHLFFFFSVSISVCVLDRLVSDTGYWFGHMRGFFLFLYSSFS